MLDSVRAIDRAVGVVEAIRAAFGNRIDFGLDLFLQIDFVAWNAMLRDQSMGIHYNRDAEMLDYVVNKEDFRIENGHIGAPEWPGLGVETDEARVRSASIDAPQWHNPPWRHGEAAWPSGEAAASRRDRNERAETLSAIALKPASTIADMRRRPG